MKESDLTEQLDERDLLAASHGPGCYAIACAVPDTVDAVESVWVNHHDAAPPDGTYERLAGAERVAYVGASGDVYERLCDHVNHAAREATFVTMFPPQRVVDVWPHERPFEREYNRAVALADRDGWVVWTNGGLHG